MINKKFSRNWTLDGIPIDNGFELSADVDELDEEIEFAKERADELENQINDFDRGDYIHRQLSTAAKQRYVERFRSIAKMAKKKKAIGGEFILSLSKVAEEPVSREEDYDPDSDKPYGDVEYADPGLRDDGKHRYPVHTKENALAAWRYINMEDNANKYTSDQLETVKNNIKDALEEFGVDYKESTRKQAKRKMALQIHWRHHIDEDGKDFWTFQTTEGQYEPLDHIDLHVTQTLEGQWEWILSTETQWGETVDDAGVEPTEERAKQAAEKKLDYYYRLFKSQMREGMVDSKEFPLFF